MQLSTKFLPIAICLSFAPTLAYAGHWQVTYSGGQSWQWSAGPYPYSMGNQGYGGGGSLAKGQITASFQWVQDYGNNLAPPDFVYVMERCSASGLGDNQSGLPAANNGLGSQIVTTTTQLGPNYTQTSKNCTGTRLRYIALGGAYGFTVKASPSASGPLGCSVAYSASTVNMGVVIGLDRDETFHKGSNNQPVTNITEIGSPRYGDTWVNPADWVWDDLEHLYGHYNVEPTFLCQKFGPWVDPLHKWTAYQSNKQDDFLHEYESITPPWKFAEEEVADLGENGAISRRVKLTVTDQGGNGISETGEYILRIHNQYDNWVIDHPLDPYYDEPYDLDVQSPGVAYYGGGIACSWVADGAMWSELTQAIPPFASVMADAFRNPFYKAGFKAAGILLDTYGPKPSNGSANFNDAWGKDWSTIDGGSWAVDQARYEMEPHLFVGYDAVFQYADTYGPHGYSGRTPDVKAKLNGAIRWGGHFRLRSPL